MAARQTVVPNDLSYDFVTLCCEWLINEKTIWDALNDQNNLAVR